MDNPVCVGDYLWFVDKYERILPVLVCKVEPSFITYKCGGKITRAGFSLVNRVLFTSRLGAEAKLKAIQEKKAAQIMEKRRISAELRREREAEKRRIRFEKYNSMSVEELIEDVMERRRFIVSRLRSPSPSSSFPRPASACDCGEWEEATLALEELRYALYRILYKGEGEDRFDLVRRSAPTLCALYRNVRQPEKCDLVYEKLSNIDRRFFCPAFFVSYAGSFLDRDDVDNAKKFIEIAIDMNYGKISPQIEAVLDSIQAKSIAYD